MSDSNYIFHGQWVKGSQKPRGGCVLVLVRLTNQLASLSCCFGPASFTRSFPVQWPKGPFLESSGNLPGPISDFGDKCILTEVNFC